MHVNSLRNQGLPWPPANFQVSSALSALGTGVSGLIFIDLSFFAYKNEMVGKHPLPLVLTKFP